MWETKKIEPNNDAKFEARLVRKYCIFKWIYSDNEFSLRVAHINRMILNKHQGNNKYNIFSTMDGYELNISHMSQ